MMTLLIVVCFGFVVAIAVGFVLYKLVEDDDGN